MEARTQKQRGFEEEDREVPDRYLRECRTMCDINGGDQLEDGCGCLAPVLALQYPDHEHTIHMACVPGNQFFGVTQHYPERLLLFLSHFLARLLTVHCQQCNDTHTNDYLLFCPGTWRRSFSACNTF